MPTPRRPSRLLRGWQAATLAVLGGAALQGCALHPGRVGYLVNAPERWSEVVATVSGPVAGVATAQGRAFLGIPFAAPPVGPLRFRAPRPATPWTQVRDATHPGPACIQRSLPGGGPYSEDCLTLDVYTDPQAGAGASETPPEPVMVWIYGGGFTLGAKDAYDLSRLAQRRHVVTVAMNYRLGALGFLDHPALAVEHDGAGDFAVLDQQAALRWIQANIARFGGDPSNVTLFGESAGGWSVCYQLASPGAAGLFQKAIIESGACTSPDSAIAEQAAQDGGVAMAAKLGCTDPATAAACLRALPAETLFKAKADRRGILGKDSWSPAYGPGLALPVSPRQAFAAGAFNRVPVIDGTNHDEARLFLALNRYKGGLRTQASYEKIIGEFFDADAPKVLAEYADVARRSPGLAYAHVVTDSTFACTAVTLDGLLAREVPVYAYEFDDPHAVSTLIVPPFTPPLKAYHSSEIAYVMQTRWAIATPAKFDPAQQALADRMQAAWADFARTGDPNGPGVTPWQRYDGAPPLQLRPDGDRAAAGFATRHRCGFWHGLGY